MMKSTMTKMALFAVGIAFVSCGKNDFLEQNQHNLIDQQKNEYRTNYVQKYGEVSPTQSWDFTNLSGSQAKTRAGESATSVRIDLSNTFWNFIKNDKDAVKSMVATAEVKEFNPYVAVELYPAFSHGKKGLKFQYYHLAACYNNMKKELTANINVKSDGWYEGGGALNHNSGRSINTKSLTTAQNAYWVAYPSYPNGHKEENQAIQDNLINYKVDTYKEFSVNGRTYWAFRCCEEGDYSDLICLVKNVDPVKPVAKRYFVEDLGSKDDFDFNDIVFDVYYGAANVAKVVIRAAGGTLPLRIARVQNPSDINDGDWSEVHDLFQAANPSKSCSGMMINTNGTNSSQPGVRSKSLDGLTCPEFTLPWEVNNSTAVKGIKIQVKKNNIWCTIDATTGGPAAKFAVPVTYDWRDERVSIKEEVTTFAAWAAGNSQLIWPD